MNPREDGSNGPDVDPAGCFCCGSPGIESAPYLAPMFESSGIFDDLEICFCRSCGFGESRPELAPELVDRFYENQFRELTGQEVEHQAISRPPVLDRRAAAQILLALQFTEFEAGDLFLDFGAGGGAALDAAGRVLPSAELAAVELNPGAREAYRRLYGARSYSHLEEAIDGGLRPKLFLMSHSLEHLRRSDVVPFLQRVSDTMAPGGVFIAEVPHLDMRIHHDRRLHDDPHLLFFSKESLRTIVEKAGLSVVFAESCSYGYEEWWAACHGKGGAVAPASNGFAGRHLLRGLLAAMPRKLEEGCVRILHKVRPDVFRLDSPEFRYGGDRTCLRVVALKA